MTRARPVHVLCLLAASLLIGCTGEPESSTDEPGGSTAQLDEVVVTTFQPTRWMAEALLGDAYAVQCLLPADADAVHWEPSRDDLQRMRRARVVVLHGAGLESWVHTASLAPSRTVDLSAGLESHFITRSGEASHSHGMTGAHSHAGLDPHLWLDPVLAIQQLTALADGLRAAEVPVDTSTRQTDTTEALLDLAQGWSEQAAFLADVPLFAAHPAYDYLAARFGFTMTSLDLDPEATTPEQAVAALAGAGAGSGSLLWWESAPRDETARALRQQLGVTSVVVDPAEGCQPGQQPDVLAVWRANLTRLRDAVASLP